VMGRNGKRQKPLSQGAGPGHTHLLQSYRWLGPLPRPGSAGARSRRQRAGIGLFPLVSQYPIEIPVRKSNLEFLRVAHHARRPAELAQKKDLDAFAFEDLVREPAGSGCRLTLVPGAQRQRRFSGGEKKRNENSQMALLKPVVAILDETDFAASTSMPCGIVAGGVNQLATADIRHLADQRTTKRLLD